MPSLFLSLILACSNNDAQQSSPTKTQAKALQPISEVIQLGHQDARTAALAPSPMETHLAAKKAGLSTQLMTLAPKREFSMDITDVNHLAMRTGVLLADTVLLIEELSKDQLMRNLGLIHDGLEKIKVNSDILSSVVELQKKIENDAISRKEVLISLEELVASSTPERGLGDGYTTGPLLQAGAWLASINLLGTALLKEDNIEAASSLLRHSQVAEYFLLYVGTKGKDTAPLALIEKLEATLFTMKDIAEKEAIEASDLKLLVKETGRFLSII